MTLYTDPTPAPAVISTHILTKRMTAVAVVHRTNQNHFNSHPHEEDDKAGTYPATYTLYFNSHPHEEDDDIHEAFKFVPDHFNSHPHEEDD